MDEISFFSWNIEAIEVASISLATFGKLNIHIQQNVISRSLCNENEKFQFLKKTFS